MNALRKNAATIAALLLGGCCGLVPCHPATYVTGRVVSTSGAPISGVAITLFSSSTSSDSSGCFSLGGPDALPFEFAVSADGYKPVRVAARPGRFQVSVVLAPSSSSANGAVSWLAAPPSRPNGGDTCT